MHFYPKKGKKFYCLAGLLTLISAVVQPRAIAQTTASIKADSSLGTIVTPNGNTYEITGGTAVGGRNLFHSFSRFDIPDSGTAEFLNDSSIVNIFSRVTGSNPSQINGLIHSQGTANVFLLNPNGIFFGKSAQLDIGGSFVATTANAWQFPSGATFSTTSSVDPNNSLLSVDPSALLFNQLPVGAIVNNSQADAGLDPSGLGSTLGLRVPDGRSLLLLGGNVTVDGSGLYAFGGRVEIGGIVERGAISLTVDGNILKTSFPSQVQRANVSLLNNSFIVVGVDGGGDIVVHANDFELSGTSLLIAGLGYNQVGKSQAGDIFVDATGVVNLSEVGAIDNIAFPGSVGNLGNINISARSLNITSGAFIASLALGQGNAGNINIKVADAVSVSGQSIPGVNGTPSPSSIISTVASLLPSSTITNPSIGAGENQGKSGEINIQARSLTVNNKAVISSTTAAGKTGNIQIQASDAVVVEGKSFISTTTTGQEKAGDLILNTSKLTVQTEGYIASSTESGGQGGNLTINANSVELGSANDKGKTGLLSATRGTGDGGNLTINTGRLTMQKAQVASSALGGTDARGGNLTVNATDSIALSQSSLSATTNGSGDAGDLTIKTGNLTLQDQTILSTGTLAQGNGGKISIQANSLSLNNSSTIVSNSLAQGKAGDIAINLGDRLNLNNGFISTTSQQTDGGNIAIAAKNISLRDNTAITSNIFGATGNGGNISLTAKTIVALENSKILAFAPGGKGGNITFDTRAFLSSPLYSSAGTPLTNQGGVTVNASGIVSGAITGVPDISFLQNNLTRLPQNLPNADNLIANSCIARSRPHGGSFLIKGSGSLPTRPGDLPVSSYPTGSVRGSATTPRTWKIGDAIVEPQGVYQLPNGQLVMSRECSQ